MASLRYGGTYSIQNGFNGWEGGYLDTRGSGCEDNYLCVSTSTSSDRAYRSGTWQIVSAQGKAAGEPVLDSDLIYLLNMFNSGVPNGGYLDTRGSRPARDGNLLYVSTAESPNRANAGTGTWRIISDSSSPGGEVQENATVHLQNGWDDWSGGFLDTRGEGCQDNLLCVSTCATWNRVSQSTHWRFHEQ